MQNIVRRLRAPKVKNYSFCARPKVFLSPGNSTCVTDIGRSVRVSRKLGRVGRSGRSVDVCVPELNGTCGDSRGHGRLRVVSLLLEYQNTEVTFVLRNERSPALAPGP